MRTLVQIERKPLTLRPRITRLVRTTIGFSRSPQRQEIVIGLLVKRYEFGLPGCNRKVQICNMTTMTMGTQHGDEYHDALLLKPSAAWHTGE
jgi:hypothetical protein